MATDTIHARTLDGDELELRVVERAKLVCIQADDDAIIMAPHEAWRRGWQIVAAAAKLQAPIPFLSARY